MLVRSIMQPRVVTTGVKTPVERAFRIMQDGNFRHLPIVDERGGLLGIVSDRDLLALGTVRRDASTNSDELVVAHSVAVEAIMRTTLVAVEPDTTVQQAVKILREKRIGCVLVTHNENLVGILSYLDILDSALTEADTNESPANFEDTQPIELAEIFSLRQQLVQELHDFEVEASDTEESVADKARRAALAHRDVPALKNREEESQRAIQQVMADVASQLDKDESRGPD